MRQPHFILNYTKYFNLFETPLLLASIFTLLIIALYFNKLSLYFLLIILLLGIATPLIFAFGIYFICQHSINAWQHLKQELLISNKTLLKEAYPFTFAAVIFFVAIVLVSYFLQSQEINILKSQFFIFLACISLPHVLLMHNFYKKQN